MNEQPADLREQIAAAIDDTYVTLKDFDSETATNVVMTVVEPQINDRDAEIERLNATIAKFRKYLDRNFRNWCSPDGVAASYATALIKELDQIADRTQSDLPAVREFVADFDPRKESS